MDLKKFSFLEEKKPGNKFMSLMIFEKLTILLKREIKLESWKKIIHFFNEKYDEAILLEKSENVW